MSSYKKKLTEYFKRGHSHQQADKPKKNTMRLWSLQHIFQVSEMWSCVIMLGNIFNKLKWKLENKMELHFLKLFLINYILFLF